MSGRMPPVRTAAIAAAVLALVAGFLAAGCGGSGSAGPSTTTAPDEPAGAPPNALPVTQPRPTPHTPTAPAPPKPPPGVTLRLTLAGGKPVGGQQRWTVRKGKRVTIVIRSDRADELHLHGYDVSRAVVPNKPAKLAFRATIPGRFELESHESDLAVAIVEVRS